MVPLPTTTATAVAKIALVDTFTQCVKRHLVGIFSERVRRVQTAEMKRPLGTHTAERSNRDKKWNDLIKTMHGEWFLL
jgi:hypothetical protein